MLDGTGLNDGGTTDPLPPDPLPPLEPAVISGRVWNDADGNRAYDGAEVGLGGVVVYSDYNLNGFLDFNEPATITAYDDPVTDFDEGGLYTLDNLQPGWHNVRQVIPDGFEQTYPSLLPGYLPPPWGDPSVHVTFVDAGQAVDGIDFGNRAFEPGAVSGLKWEDVNGNGVRDEGELGLPGVVIYSDRNANGVLDPDEPSTVTSEDDPYTDFDESGFYVLAGLEPGIHWIKEVVPDGFQQTFPNFWWLANPDGDAPSTHPDFAPIPIPGGGWHDVVIEPGQAVDGIDFGNQRITTGSISGVKWNDINGNGVRDNNEPGLPGVTIYLDLNFNTQLDDNEPIVVTSADDPFTDFDEGGQYAFTVDPGLYAVREVVPDGFRQTFPNFDHPTPFPSPLLRPSYPGEELTHFVPVSAGESVDGVDFGNQRIEPATGVVSGRKWLDADGNREQGPNEPGLAGVTIYADLNQNGVLDTDEPSTVTMADIPETDFDEAGLYHMELPAGEHWIAEVVPDGFTQTFPAHPVIAIFPPPPGGGVHFVTVLPGQSIDGLDFGNRPTENGSVSGTKWHDLNGNGERDPNEPGLAGVTIYADYNFNGQLDVGEPSTETFYDPREIFPNDTGTYELEVRPGFMAIREIVPDGYFQTFPISDAASPLERGAHFVSVEPGANVPDLDFGNQALDNFPAGVSGRKWEDSNANGLWDADESGLGGVTIYVDTNFNGVFDANEPSAVTMYDIPETDFDEGGLYSIGNLQAGLHVVREVVPNGFVQTFPISIAASPLESGAHVVSLAPGEHVDGLNFGNLRFGIPLPGDFNGDGTVDSADLELWEQSYGSGASQAAADVAEPTSGRDFLVWQQNHGRTQVAPPASEGVTAASDDDVTSETLPTGLLREAYRPPSREESAAFDVAFAEATIRTGTSAFAAPTSATADDPAPTNPTRGASASPADFAALAAAIDAALEDEFET